MQYVHTNEIAVIYVVNNFIFQMTIESESVLLTVTGVNSE